MTDIVIRCEGLGKKYRIGANRNGRYVALRDVLAERFRGIGQRLLGRANGDVGRAYEEIWALKDVSFDVRRGECVGIIGRNGAGKSTLLKLLSRITEPTEGRIRLRGRVASLLEVGTGFHPELTGRENIYLNGAILGMKRAEIRRKFDEIVAFAEVEKFIDTPVKHFSSGMYMRLAFAVAAHLEPEILVVDEVLAVGDTAFQKKCLGKMGQVANEGRTVLFVSHNMHAIHKLCQSAVCLESGRLDFSGATGNAVLHYHQLLDKGKDGPCEAYRRPGTGEIRFVYVKPAQPTFRPDEEKVIKFSVAIHSPALGPVFLSAHVLGPEGQLIAQCDSRLAGVFVGQERAEGNLVLREPWLKPGDYSMDFYLCTNQAGIVDHYERACLLRITSVLPYDHSAPDGAFSYGIVLADFRWHFNR